MISVFAELEIVKHAFAGIRICVCVLIFNAVLKLGKQAVIDKPTFMIALLVALLAFFTDLPPTVFVLLAAAAGILIQLVKQRGGKQP